MGVTRRLARPGYASSMRRAVLLLHETPGGGRHFDWLIERAAGEDEDERALAAFRVAVRIDRTPTDAFDADRIQDHRRVYLTRQGAISGGRGDVTRLATGTVIELEQGDSEMMVVIDWGGRRARYEGKAIHGNESWRFNAGRASGR